MPCAMFPLVIEPAHLTVNLHLSLFSFWRNIQFVLNALHGYLRETCNSHSVSNFVRMMYVHCNAQLWELTVHLIWLLYHCFQFEETLILDHNALLYYISEKYVISMWKPAQLEGWIFWTIHYSGNSACIS
jgi:hypothetical protein